MKSNTGMLIRLPGKLRDEVRAAAEEWGLSSSAFVKVAIRKQLKKQGQLARYYKKEGTE